MIRGRTWAITAAGYIHYFSLCGGGHVARLALADISGHGRTVHDIAQTLRKLMRKHIEGLERVAIVGRGGTFRYNNADHSIEMGLLTAQMINGKVDKAAVLDVNTSQEYGEKGLVSGTADAANTT